MSTFPSKKAPAYVSDVKIGAATVTPNDASDLPKIASGIYVGATGDLVVTFLDGNTVTLKGLASGVIHPLCVKRVLATGTTATGIIAMY